MSSLRKTKKEIAYLANEVISNCYMAIYFQPETSHEELMSVVDETVTLHNKLITSVNSNPEQKNKKLTSKYYQSIKTEMFEGMDSLFNKISDICQK